jgi:hypothetical protein
MLHLGDLTCLDLRVQVGALNWLSLLAHGGSGAQRPLRKEQEKFDYCQAQPT